MLQIECGYYCRVMSWYRCRYRGDKGEVPVQKLMQVLLKGRVRCM